MSDDQKKPGGPDVSLREGLRGDILQSIMTRRDGPGLQEVLGRGWPVDALYKNSGPTPVHQGPIPVRRVFNPSGPDKWMSSTFHLAVRCGWKEGIQVLLDAGANPNIADDHAPQDHRDTDKFTPLMRAIEGFGGNINMDFIHFLLSHGCDINSTCPVTGHSPITIAVSKVNRPVTRLLIAQYKVDANSTRDGRLSLLQIALTNILNPPQHVTDITMAIYTAASDESDETLPSPVLLSIYQNAIQIFKDLVSLGADLHATHGRQTPLLTLISSKKFVPELLDFLYDNGCDINTKYEEATPLCQAVSFWGHENNMRWLIRHGADTNVKPIQQVQGEGYFIGTLTGQAVSAFRYDLAWILLQAGVKSSWKDYQSVQRLLSKYTNVPESASETEEEGTSGSIEEAEGGGTHKEVPFQVSDESRSQQSIDLSEFSNKFLLLYPEERFMSRNNFLKADQYHRLKQTVNFLGKPQELQFICRGILRRCLPSLDPSFIKRLPVAPPIKRYILCHEV